MKNLILLIGTSLFSLSASAYVPPANSYHQNDSYQQQTYQQNGSYQQPIDRNAPSTSYQQNNSYQQQIDRNAPESTAGAPRVGPDGTEYPSNDTQDEDTEW